MKVRDWYELLLKENMTHENVNGELVLKKSRMIYSHHQREGESGFSEGCPEG